MCKQCGKAKCACKPAKKSVKAPAKKAAPMGKKDKDKDKDDKKPAFLKKGKK